MISARAPWKRLKIALHICSSISVFQNSLGCAASCRLYCFTAVTSRSISFRPRTSHLCFRTRRNFHHTHIKLRKNKQFTSSSPDPLKTRSVKIEREESSFSLFWKSNTSWCGDHRAVSGHGLGMLESIRPGIVDLFEASSKTKLC
jgi:hypothetical protein